MAYSLALGGHKSRITQCAFNPQVNGAVVSIAKYVLTIRLNCSGGDCRLWDVCKEKEVRSISLASTACQTTQWHPSGNAFCAGFHSRLYQVVDPRSGSSVCEWVVGVRVGDDS